MNKIKILLLLSSFTATVFAQTQPKATPQPQQTQPQQNANKSIADIVNEKLSGQINDEKQKKEKLEQEKATEDLSKYYQTPGSDYDKKINTGLDDYRGRKDELQRRIEELKLEREAKIKQQVELESKMRLEALRIAEEGRIKQLQIEAQKKKEFDSAATANKAEEKKKPQRKIISSDTKDYYEKQRKLMESQSY